MPETGEIFKNHFLVDDPGHKQVKTLRGGLIFGMCIQTAMACFQSTTDQLTVGWVRSASSTISIPST